METTSHERDRDQPDAGASSQTTRQLLARFVERRDQAAFAELLRVYGPLVYGACRRVLGNHHDAEDVFQSTFLTLARKAGSIQHQEGLAAWLHRVAYHASLRAKSVIATRKKREMRMKRTQEPAVVEPDRWPELEPLLDQELNNLPIKYRLPVLLCDLAGKTHKEAAQQLGCPEGTLSTRLIRARSLLATRLTRQGLVLSSATLVALLTQNAASAAVPGTLVTSTLAAATSVGAAQSTAAGASGIKVLAWIQSVWHSIGVAHVTLAGVVGAGLMTAALALQSGNKQAEKSAPQTAPPAVAGVKLAAPFEEIADTYRRNYAAIKTLRLEFTVHHERLIEPSVAWNAWRVMPLQPGENLSTLVIDRDKVYTKFRQNEQDRNTVVRLIKEKHPEKFKDPQLNPDRVISFDDLLEAIPHAPLEKREHIILYDGQRIRDNNSGLLLGDGKGNLRTVLNVKSPANADRPTFQNPNYLDLVFYGITAATLPLDAKFRERFRMPDLLANGTWRVVAEREPVDGADCLVIESSETDKLWLDPKAGFAPRRMTKQPPFRADAEFHDLRHIEGDMWIPHSIVTTGYAEANVPPQYLGKPSFRSRIELKRFELNQSIPSDTFELTPPPDAMVFDSTNQFPGDLGNSAVPGAVGPPNVGSNPAANPSGTPQGAIAAQIAVGADVHPANPSRTMRTILGWFILINVLLLAGGYIAYRRWSA